MRYDYTSKFLNNYITSFQEYQEEPKKLSSFKLDDVVNNLLEAEIKFDSAWELCAPYMDLSHEDPKHPTTIPGYSGNPLELATHVGALSMFIQKSFLEGMYFESSREAMNDYDKGRKQLGSILFSASYSLISAVNTIKQSH
jgi:hypothetical protein